MFRPSAASCARAAWAVASATTTDIPEIDMAMRTIAISPIHDLSVPILYKKGIQIRSKLGMVRTHLFVHRDIQQCPRQHRRYVSCRGRLSAPLIPAWRSFIARVGSSETGAAISGLSHRLIRFAVQQARLSCCLVQLRTVWRSRRGLSRPAGGLPQAWRAGGPPAPGSPPVPFRCGGERAPWRSRRARADQGLPARVLARLQAGSPRTARASRHPAQP